MLNPQRFKQNLNDTPSQNRENIIQSNNSNSTIYNSSLPNEELVWNQLENDIYNLFPNSQSSNEEENEYDLGRTEIINRIKNDINNRNMRLLHEFNRLKRWNEEHILEKLISHKRKGIF